MEVLLIILFAVIGIVSGWFGKRFLRIVVPLLTWICFTCALLLIVLEPIWSQQPPISNKFILTATFGGPVLAAALLGFWIKVGIFAPLMFSGYLVSTTVALLIDHFLRSERFLRLLSINSSTAAAFLQNLDPAAPEYPYARWISLGQFLYYSRMFGFFQWPSSIMFVVLNCLVGVIFIFVYLKIPHRMVIFGPALCGNWFILYAVFESVGLIQGSCNKIRTFYPYERVTWLSCSLFCLSFLLSIVSVWVQFRGEQVVKEDNSRWELFSLEES